MHTNFALLFYLKKPKNYVSGHVPIYIRITVDGQRMEISANREINPADWNKDACKMKGTNETAKTLNKHLDQLRHNMYTAEQIIHNKNLQLTAQNLKDTFQGKQEKPRFLLEIFEDHNKQVNALIGNEFAQGTAIRYATSLKHTRNFIQWKYRQKDMDIRKINHEFITGYDYWLRTERKCNNNSTIKYIKNFKKIINICIANSWLEKNPFVNYKGKTKQVDREYLTQEEIDRIIKKVFVNERLHQVRDIFLFSCYTGLAYADVHKLKRSEIIQGVDGEKWIITYRTKTKIPSRIPLLPFAKQLLERYEDHPTCFETGAALPVLSNQKMNAYLKEIADLCDIVKSLTFHIARHTFATSITLANGVPIESVSKMLGHSTIRMTQHYAKILDITVGKDMSVLKKKLESNHIAEQTQVKKLASEPAIQVEESALMNEDDIAAMVCTNYIQAAKVEAKAWIAPILRKTECFEGLKIAVDAQSYEKYLNYRDGNTFRDYDDFYTNGKVSYLNIHYLAGTDYGHIREAAYVLNESRYIVEGKLKVAFEKIMFENSLFHWVEI
jgi:site-specific recombinase XerD